MKANINRNSKQRATMGQRQAAGPQAPKRNVSTPMDFMYGDYVEVAQIAAERSGKEVVTKAVYCERLAKCLACLCFAKVQPELPEQCHNVVAKGGDLGVLWCADSRCPREDDCQWGKSSHTTYMALVDEQYDDQRCVIEVMEDAKDETTD